MLIDTTRVLAMRCPRCGRLELNYFSLFGLGESSPTLINCQCGCTLASIVRRSRLYKLQVECIICETPHELLVDVGRVIHNDALVLYCPESDVDLALIGNGPRVDELLAEEGDILANVVGSSPIDSEFNDAAVMREVLTRLQDWVDEGRLYCSCGNRHMEVELFPEKVEVACPHCGGTLVIYAEREEDLLALDGLEEVVLKRGAFTCIDSADFRYRHGV